jgi:hypothetical protein
VRTTGGVTRTALVVIALALVTGCMGGARERPRADVEQRRQSTDTSSAKKTDGVRARLRWRRSFALPASGSTRRFEVAAPDPASHSFRVRIHHEPASAQVFVTLRTWYGNLTVIDPNVHPLAVRDGTKCEERAGRRTCLVRFPSFAAERAGRWTVTVEKLSGSAADVDLDVQFTHVRARPRSARGVERFNSTRRFDRNGIRLAYPRTWSLTVEPLSPVGNPVYRFAVSSVPVQQTAADEGPCLPGIARQLPPDAVVAYVREALGADRARSLPRLPSRPASFPLPRGRGGGLCGFERGAGAWLPFKDAGRAFYLGVHVGPQASAASRRALRELLDGMEIRAR